MSLYPSLEDMKVDQLSRAQTSFQQQIIANTQPQYVQPPQYAEVPEPGLPSQYSESQLPYSLKATAPASSSLYPELYDYMGLELSEEVIAQNMPEYSIAVRQSSFVAVPQGPLAGMVAPLSGNSVGLQRAQVTHGIRELTICKDGSGKVGVRVESVNNGVFVCLVSKQSPAALAGLRFGDQILQVNGTVVAGFSMDKVHDLFRKSPANGISVVVRDRPFERTVTLHKDSTGHIGFSFKNGKIIGLVKDSSAARNGLLTEHHLLEVNGQNVVGSKDKEITGIIDEGGDIITVTIIPTFVYEHMVKKMAPSLLKGKMDHSIPV